MRLPTDSWHSISGLFFSASVCWFKFLAALCGIQDLSSPAKRTEPVPGSRSTGEKSYHYAPAFVSNDDSQIRNNKMQV